MNHNSLETGYKRFMSSRLDMFLQKKDILRLFFVGKTSFYEHAPHVLCWKNFLQKTFGSMADYATGCVSSDLIDRKEL